MKKPQAPFVHLGQPSRIPDAPDAKTLDRVPNPQADTDYITRFTAPEFTSICPVTGQPDFAHLVIDYAPDKWIVESKSLKLYLMSFRNHGAFHEECTVRIGRDLVGLLKPRWFRIGGYWFPRGGIPIERLLADRQAAEGDVDPRPGRCSLSRPRLTEDLARNPPISPGTRRLAARSFGQGRKRLRPSQMEAADELSIASRLDCYDVREPRHRSIAVAARACSERNNRRPAKAHQGHDRGRLVVAVIEFERRFPRSPTRGSSSLLNSRSPSRKPSLTS